MKSKSGGLFGIFKKKTSAPPPPVAENSTTDGGQQVETTAEATMAPRKGSIASTSVIHYSPPGTVRASPPSAPSSVVSSYDEESGAVIITRKSNIVLEDEESVISTPISQYEESIPDKSAKKKRVAPAPPPPQATVPQPAVTLSTVTPPTVPQVTRITVAEAPPPPPPHKAPAPTQPLKVERESPDLEEMLKNLQVKFAEWNKVKLEDGGSMREERMKEEVLKEHEKIKGLLDKEIKGERVNGLNNNGKDVRIVPPSPAITRKVPGGTDYQKIQKPKPSPVHSRSRSTDENRNEIPKPVQKTSIQNTAAVDRLRREVEEQRAREKEVKQYRNPKELTVVTSPVSSKSTPSKSSSSSKSSVPMSSSTPISSKPTSSQSPMSPTTPTTPMSPKSPRSPKKMVEYRPMKSPGLPEEQAPPIPKTPPPKLSDYRKEAAPRMPDTNGYVRVHMKKGAAPSPYNGPEYASSPKLLRKTVDSPKLAPKVAPIAPVKEERKEKIYQRPQMHPQHQNGLQNGIQKPPSPPKSPYQKGMISTIIANASASSSSSATSSATSSLQNVIYQKTIITTDNNVIYQKMPVKPSPMTRGFSVDEPVAPKPKSPVIQRKVIPEPPKLMRTTSEDQKTSDYQRMKMSATSPPYQKITKPAPKSKSTSSEGFDISDVLRGPKLRKVGMPTERSGISLGKVVDNVESTGRPSTVPPPPPPPPPPVLPVALGAPPKGDLRDSLMSEIREAGRLRAARVSQTA